MKLGELLILGGQLNQEQLAQALRRQKLMGGRLGSNLLELRLISERILTRALSRQTKLPETVPDDFESILPDVLRLIPRKYAQERLVLPLRRDGRKLEVAVIEPLDINTTDTLEFLTGCKLFQRIAPEVRILYGLERHYQINRNFRFVNILRGGPPPEMWGMPDAGQPDWVGPSPPVGPELPATMSPPAAASLSTPPEDADIKHVFLDASSWTTIVARLLETVRHRLERVILFSVSQNAIKAWYSVEEFRGGQEGQVVEISPEAPTFVRAMERYKGMYFGPIEMTELHGTLIGAIGALFPSEVIILPLPIGDGRRMILYGDNLISRRPVDAPQEIERYYRMALLALKIYSLRKRLESV